MFVFIKFVFRSTFVAGHWALVGNVSIERLSNDYGKQNTHTLSTVFEAFRHGVRELCTL